MEESHTSPANEKSCQTDDLTDEAVVPGPDHASRTLVISTEAGDPPLLQRPDLQTSRSGIQQIMQCFCTGTAQLKHMLLKEVDTIFECKLCRSLFRGLPNLIKHREVYCISRQTEDSSAEGKKSIRELLETLCPRSDNEHVLRLEPIAGNQNSVYQHLSREKDLPPSSQSPSHTSTEDWSHLHSNRQEPHTEEVDMDGEEEHCAEEQEINKEDEDAVESEEHQDTEMSSEDRTEETAVKDFCKCLMCNRTYKVQGRLQRHLRLVHNIITSVSVETMSDSKKTVKGGTPESSDACASSSGDSQVQKSPGEKNKVPWKPVFSSGFDFKALFCRLCKRTFSSEQNLARHMEFHTDNGTEFFVRFYCCPLCSYKTRRKRDVVRHLSILHKKSSTYLRSISQSLDNSAIKKPAEIVLNKEEPKIQHQPEAQLLNNYSSPYRTRRNLTPSNAPREAAITQKRHEEEKSSMKVKRNRAENRVKKSRHVCRVCGLSFKKLCFLGSHMTSHQKTAGRRATAVNTRSKVVLW